jgi:hypothetical protein
MATDSTDVTRARIAGKLMEKLASIDPADLHAVTVSLILKGGGVDVPEDEGGDEGSDKGGDRSDEGRPDAGGDVPDDGSPPDDGSSAALAQLQEYLRKRAKRAT